MAQSGDWRQPDSAGMVRGLPGMRDTSRDRAAIAVGIDPSWLLAPLFARDVAGLVPAGDGYPGALVPPVTEAPVSVGEVAGTSAVNRTQVRTGLGTNTADDAGASSDLAADWPTWWAGALAFRPGTPAPRPPDLFGGSAALARLWARLAGQFDAWLAARPTAEAGSDVRARAVERTAVAGFAALAGRDPGRWTVRVLQIPVAGRYLHSPEPRRIVVSAALRADPRQYADALAAALPEHF